MISIPTTVNPLGDAVFEAKAEVIVVKTIINNSVPYIFFLPNKSARYPNSSYPISVPIKADYFNKVSDTGHNLSAFFIIFSPSRTSS